MKIILTQHISIYKLLAINTKMTTQEIQFELLRNCPKFKDNSEIIIKSLIENQAHWDSMIVDNEMMVKLRDIGDNIWNADTIYILTHDKSAMEPIVESWYPSAWEWVSDVNDYLCGIDVDAHVIKIWFN